MVAKDASQLAFAFCLFEVSGTNFEKSSSNIILQIHHGGRVYDYTRYNKHFLLSVRRRKENMQAVVAYHRVQSRSYESGNL